MRLHLLPIIPILAWSSTTAISFLIPLSGLSAAELAEGFTLGGYGEVLAHAEHQEENNPHRAQRTSSGDNWSKFSSDAAIKIGYKVDRFRLRSDLLAYSEAPFADGNHLILEQTFIDWEAQNRITVRAGRFQTTWLGWEGFHTPELWRVNHSAAWDWNVQNHALKPNRPFLTNGVGILTRPTDSTGLEFYIADPILGTSDSVNGFDKTVGASAWWKGEGVGRIELAAALEPRAVNTSTNPTVSGNDASSLIAVDLNADLTTWKDQGWFFAAEAQYHNHPDLQVGPDRYGNDLILLAMANKTLKPGMSLTVMVDWVERGTATPDNEVLETAVSLMTRPHAQVRFNTEVFYWQERADKADSYGAAGVLLVALP